MAKILLVEDDKSLREIYNVRLLAEGYTIVAAGDGEEALAMAIKEKPDLIVSDVMMPKISGFDMLDILRSTTETKNVKVIMMTALSSDDQRARGEALGADRYLVKSQVGIEDVVRTVHEVLGDSVGAAPVPVNPFLASTPTPAAEPAPEPVPAPTVAPTVDAPAPETPVAEPVVTPSEPAAPVAPADPLASTLSSIPMPELIETPAPFAAPAPTPEPTPVSAPAPEAAPETPVAPTPELNAEPITTPEPPAPIEPAVEAPAPKPAPAPTPEPTPAPMPVQPVQAPAAPLPPVINASTVVPQRPMPVVAPTASGLPEPTAPFSTPRPGSAGGDRVINPLTPAESGTPDMGALLSQELNAAPAPVTPPVPPTPPIPPLPPQPGA